MYMSEQPKSIQRRARQVRRETMLLIYSASSAAPALNIPGVYWAGTVASTGVENELSWLLELTAVVT
jgi:hypothetical protein